MPAKVITELINEVTVKRFSKSADVRLVLTGENIVLSDTGVVYPDRLEIAANSSLEIASGGVLEVT